MIPMPTVFSFVNDGKGGFGLSRIHPLPENKLIKVDAAGMGFIIMHRSIIPKIREIAPDGQVFMEMGRGTKFIGEDCVANPDLVATKYPLASAAFFFNSNSLWAICDKGADDATVTAVTVTAKAASSVLAFARDSREATRKQQQQTREIIHAFVHEFVVHELVNLQKL